jgi:dTDP-4-amino-4,6-dideoxygalactose transaminase
MSKISCLDLKSQHQQLKQEIFHAFEKVYDSTAFSSGVFVEEFEKNFAKFCHAKYAVGLNNGTSAIHLAILAAGVKPGDEVIVPANTFIATAWGVSYAGATPVFVDCDEDSWQIDASKIEASITLKTKAIVGVHLYGQPFNIQGVSDIASRNNLLLIEDAAQAQGATYKGTKVGTFGEMGCFSFYPGKNLGACGEAGGITTNSEAYYKHLQRLRNHGSETRYYHDEIGFNMRMGGLEGSSLNIKLKYLDSWNGRRREIAKRYQTEITNKKIKMQLQPEGVESIYHLFVITTAERNEFITYLNSNDIFPGLHYPVPCHLQKAYHHLGYKKGDMPNSEYLADHCCSLPMYPELTNAQVERVIQIVNKY